MCAGNAKRAANYKGVPANILTNNTSTFSARLAAGGTAPSSGMAVMRGAAPAGMAQPYGMQMNMPVMMPGCQPMNIMTVVPSPALAVQGGEEAIQTYRPTVMPNSRQAMNHAFLQLLPAGQPAVIPGKIATP